MQDIGGYSRLRVYRPLICHLMAGGCKMGVQARSLADRMVERFLRGAALLRGNEMSKPQMISMTLVVAMLACAIMLLQACRSKKQATPARMAMPPSPLPATYPALEHQPVRGVAAV